MARVNFARNDIVGDFLPNVAIRRITLETGAEDQTVTTVDLSIDDVLDNELRRATKAAVHERYTDEMTTDAVLDQATKLCVIVTTSAAADLAVRTLFQSKGQTSNFQDRLRQITQGIESDSLSERMNARASINYALTLLAARNPNITYFTQPARPNQGDEYLASVADHFKEYDVNNEIVHKFHKSIRTISRSRIQKMTIYAFSFMDFSIFDLDIDASEIAFLNNIYGRVSKCRVFNNGRPDPHKMVLLDDRGTPYVGPYHVMQNGTYMQGRFHSTDDPSQYLTPIMVPNVVVQDFRKFERSERDLYSPSTLPAFLSQRPDLRFLKNAKVNQFNSKAEIDHDPDSGEVTLEFLIDQEQIFEDNSKYGYLYANLPNATKYKIMRPRDYFRLAEIKIKRRRVTKRPLGANTLGMPAPDIFDREKSETIIAQTGERTSQARNILQSRIFERTDLLIPALSPNGAISDEPFEGLGWEDQSLSEWFEQPPNTPLPLTVEGTPPFPFYRNFIGRDDSLENVYQGEYQYGIELTYEDGFEKYLGEVFATLRKQTKILERYYSECTIPVMTAKYHSRAGLGGPSAEEIFPDYRQKTVERVRETGGGSYNHLTKTFTPSFVARALEEYDLTSMVQAYFEAINIVFADASFRVGNLGADGVPRMSSFDIDNVVSLLRPENSRPQQIANVLKSFQELQGQMEDILDVDLVKDTYNIDLTRGDSGSSGRPPRFIKVRKYFGDADDFVDASKRYRPSVSTGIFDLLNPMVEIEPPYQDLIKNMPFAEEPLEFEMTDRAAIITEKVKRGSVLLSENKDNVINRQKIPTLIEKVSSVETGKLGLMTETLAQKLVKSTSQVSKGSKSKTTINKKRSMGSHTITAEQAKDVWVLEEVKFGMKEEEDPEMGEAPLAFSMNSFSMGLGNPTVSFSPQPIDTDAGDSFSGITMPFSPGTEDAMAPAFQMIDDAVEVGSANAKRNTSWGEMTKDIFGGIFQKITGAETETRTSMVDSVQAILDSDLSTENNTTFFTKEIASAIENLSPTTLQDTINTLCDVVPVEPRPVIDFFPKDLFKAQFAEETKSKKNGSSLTKKSEAMLKVIKGSRKKDSKTAKKSKVLLPILKKVINKPAVLTEKMTTTTMTNKQMSDMLASAPPPKSKKPVTEEDKLIKNPPLQLKNFIQKKPSPGADKMKVSKTMISTMQKVQKQVGFEKDSKGKPILNKPVFKDVKVKEVKKGLAPGKYKMVPVSLPKAGIEKDPIISSGKKFFTVKAPVVKNKPIKKDPPPKKLKIMELENKSKKTLMSASSKVSSKKSIVKDSQDGKKIVTKETKLQAAKSKVAIKETQGKMTKPKGSQKTLNTSKQKGFVTPKTSRKVKTTSSANAKKKIEAQKQAKKDAQKFVPKNSVTSKASKSKIKLKPKKNTFSVNKPSGGGNKGKY
jgi:hypothetical protein